MLSQLYILPSNSPIDTTISHIQTSLHAILSPQFSYNPQTNPDLILINTQESIKIEHIRHLSQQITIKPLKHAHKIILIHNAQQLTLPAQHALLKTLEEPPEYALIILTAPNHQSLLPTILSRCLITHIHPTPTQPTQDSPHQLTDILAKKPIDRLTVSTSIKDRQQALTLISDLLKQTHLLIKSSPTPQLSRTLKTLLQTQQYLQANTHVQLTLDQCLLSL